MRPFVKVCGITRLEDALAAVAAGADAIGFVLEPGGPRSVDPETAGSIAARLPGTVARVGVTVDAPAATVRRWSAAAGLTAVQAHGDEPPELCREYRLPVIKAIPCAPGLAADALEPYREFPVLLDGFQDGRRGGTGRRADWELAAAMGRAGFRIVLAGGLSPRNLSEAVRSVEPLAVDLNSGVESGPGLKDAERIRAAMTRLDGLPPRPREENPWL